MARILVLLIAAIALAGCSIFQKPEPEVVVVTETVEVEVPYYLQRDPPEWLASGYQPQVLPVFISPDDPEAVVGLDEQAADDLRVILRTLRERDEAWIEWSSDPPEQPTQ